MTALIWKHTKGVAAHVAAAMTLIMLFSFANTLLFNGGAYPPPEDHALQGWSAVFLLFYMVCVAIATVGRALDWWAGK